MVFGKNYDLSTYVADPLVVCAAAPVLSDHADMVAMLAVAGKRRQKKRR